MKKLVLTLTLAIAALLSFAQIPQTFSYQGVVRDAESKIVAEKSITVSVQILQGTDEGTEVYAETHEVTTNANGLMTFELGSKNAEDFAKIDWSNAPYFVKTVASFDGKQISGVTPLLAVPYALYAAKAGNADVDLSAYATKEEIPSTDGFATKEDLNALNIPSVEGLASESYVDEKVAAINLSNYYLKSDVDNLLAELNAKVKKLDKQLNPPVGAIQAGFSVSAEKKIYFSQGNLQYQASTGTWRFAEKQWDYVGYYSDGTVYENGVKCNNRLISETYEGWIDMFGWGTSGYNSKNPYMTSTTNTDYGDGANDIAGTNYDWGVYNKISNGGNQAGLWRTPTMGEWYYLLYSRTDASNKVGVASVNNVNGLVLLPDDWSLPNDVTFKSGLANGQGAEYYKTINEYTVDDWTKMEANGAVFLPAAGLRFENQMQSYGEIGNYWSSSCYLKNDEEWAKYPYFYSCLLATDYWPRHYGLAVRLVQDAE
ncbi:MAG: hypothetical protein IKO90_08615 [Bacteroidales bacterium]|nr:hypothetical protein [Bacteroidales bacterium]